MFSMNNKNFNEIVSEIKKQTTKEGAEDFLMKQLEPEQSRRLQDILGDKSAIEQLLSTPQAKSLLKKLTEDENG